MIGCGVQGKKWSQECFLNFSKIELLTEIQVEVLGETISSVSYTLNLRGLLPKQIYFISN